MRPGPEPGRKAGAVRKRSAETSPRQDFPLATQNSMMLRSPEGATYVAGLMRATGNDFLSVLAAVVAVASVRALGV